MTNKFNKKNYNQSSAMQIIYCMHWIVTLNLSKKNLFKTILYPQSIYLSFSILLQDSQTTLSTKEGIHFCYHI